MTRAQLPQVLRYMLDEAEFLSPMAFVPYPGFIERIPIS